MSSLLKIQVSQELTYRAADHREVSKGWIWQAEHQPLKQGEKENLGSDFPVIVNSILGSTGTTKGFANVEKEDMSNSQRRSSKNRAGQTHLIFCDEVINLVDEEGGADAVYVGVEVRLVILCHMVSLQAREGHLDWEKV